MKSAQSKPPQQSMERFQQQQQQQLKQHQQLQQHQKPTKGPVQRDLPYSRIRDSYPNGFQRLEILFY